MFPRSRWAIAEALWLRPRFSHRSPVSRGLATYTSDIPHPHHKARATASLAFAVRRQEGVDAHDGQAAVVLFMLVVKRLFLDLGALAKVITGVSMAPSTPPRSEIRSNSW